MRVVYEGAIFEILKNGGVVRYYNELIKRLPVSIQPIVTTPNDYDFQVFHPRLVVEPIRTKAPIKMFRSAWRRAQHAAIEQKIEGLNADITHWTYYTGLCRRPVQRGSAANVITVYDFIHEAYPEEDRGGNNRAWQRQAIDNADHLCCISQTTYDELCNRYPSAANKASVTPLGNTFSSVKSVPVSKELTERPFILFVGRRTGYKNFETLYKAWRKARQRVPELDLVLAGPPLKPRERKKLGMDHAVDGLIHLGFVSDNELKGLYQACHAFVFPSKMEGFGLPAVEAMNTGATVVASSCGALKEVIGSAGYFFDAEDTDSLADILLAVGAENLPDKDSKVNEGHLRAKEFSWQRTTDQTVAAYQELAKRHQQPEILSMPSASNISSPSIHTGVADSASAAHSSVSTDECRVCGFRAKSFASAKVLGKYEIEYFRCDDCQFIQTEKPYWLDEAYADAIISTDLGLVGRNQQFSAIASRVLRHVHSKANRCIDYGGGYGMFTRMMRDRGHDFRHHDPYCENLFAKGFVAKPSDDRFDLLTAFEVWEHMAVPHEDISKMDSLADHWLVSTMLVPEPAPLPNEWWYYVLDGGQHVALWSERALQAIASQYGRKVITTDRGLHLFSKTSVNRTLTRKILRGKGGAILDRIRRRKSLLQADFEVALKVITEKQAA